ncbi:MAG: LegC family aminotransferase, partial [Candidatus Aenigmatarchaeota archaeon]
MTRCNIDKFSRIVEFIKDLYRKDKVALHEPVFLGNEKKYLCECVDSTYVSYVGEFVTKFEKIVSEYTKSKYAIATVNGTTALHIALKAIGVECGDEVITQSLTFVATANAIAHCGAFPVFVDVDKDTLGMSLDSLEYFLKENTIYDTKKKVYVNKNTKRPIKAVVPVHIFGHPCRIDEIVKIAQGFNLPVIEDSAEALGSLYKSKHCGTFGLAGVLSFNGNKTITTGGGGMVLTDDENLAGKIRHLSTTAKISHPWEYIHDEVGYNYRLPNINAALGYAQMEYIDKVIENKRETALAYKNFFKEIGVDFFEELNQARSNYWLNAIIWGDSNEKEEFLSYTNKNSVTTRPIWRPMH